MIYAVNRFYEDKTPFVQKRTEKVLISLSNRGSGDAAKYGTLIEKKGVLGGVWRFVGTIESDVPPELIQRVFCTGGSNDKTVLRRTGIDVSRMR